MFGRLLRRPPAPEVRPPVYTTPVPVNLDEARAKVRHVAAAQLPDMVPPHWPADPIIALCQLSLDLIERVEELERNLQ